MTSKTVSFQELQNGLIGVIRIHPEGGTYLDGSPYDWSATCQIIGSDSYLFGVTKTVKPSQWRALANYFRSIGVTKVHWVRHNTLDREVTIYL